MRTVPVVSYEALILFPQSAMADLKTAVEHIKDVLTKANAEIIAIKKWGDRALAYPIKKQKRGLYILAYYKVSTDKLAGIERSLNLSEQVLRFLITRADHLTLEEMKSADGQIDLMIEANLRMAAQPTPDAPPPSSVQPPMPMTLVSAIDDEP